MPHKHRYGYACINMTLKEQGITCNRGLQYKTLAEEGITVCGERALLNMQGMLEILKWNLKHDIFVYRLSSRLFPWMTEYSLPELPQWSDIRPLMEECGKVINENGMRVSFHPGPFNNFTSENPRVIKATIKELEAHSEVLDWLDQPQSRQAKINIHMGGIYGDKDSAMKRFSINFPKLSAEATSRFTLENDDKESLYSVADLYKVYEEFGVATVFDGHHWEVGAKSGTYQEDFLKATSTWGDIIPTCHWSNSRKEWEDPESKLAAHTDWYYKTMPVPDIDLDIVLESKMKELALLKYLKG